MIAGGGFREDFYYRINVIPIHIPPLRDRSEDIPLLARSFFNRIRLKSGKKLDGISKPAMDLLMRYHWPGNARELKSAFEFAFVSCPGGMISPDHLPPQIASGEPVCNPAALSLDESIDDVKRRRLLDALRRTKGNQSETARLLGISRTSVWNQMKKYKIEKNQLEI
jgi:transcriptional regulator with PAS, ATPase and Fis domain